MHSPLMNLLVILGMALAAPLLGSAVRGVRVPVVVVEIALGIVVGPQVLGWVTEDRVIHAFGEFGLAFLLFLAGYELDLDAIRGQPLLLAIAGWGLSLGLALAAALLLQQAGLGQAPLYVALALSTTALGALLPIVRDAGVLATPSGRYFLAIGTVGEFGPILLVALLLGDGGGAASTVGLIVFVVAVMLAMLVARRWRPGPVLRLLRTTMHSSAQFAVRLSIAFLLGLVVLAESFGLDHLLGAFAAGLVVGQAIKLASDDAHEELESLRVKYEGIGFGLLIPIFFVVSGISFDLDAVVQSPRTLLLVPLFLLLMLAVRGLPVLGLYRGVLPLDDRLSLALLAGTQLPLVIAITGLGVKRGVLPGEVAAAMVGAAMLSVFLFPLIALARRAGQTVAIKAEASS